MTGRHATPGSHAMPGPNATPVRPAMINRRAFLATPLLATPLLATSLVTASFLAAIKSAAAHAFLTRAHPPVGGTMAAAPATAMLSFTEAIEPSLSAIEVRDAKDQRRDTGPSYLAEGDPKRLAVALRPLKAGTYTVRWRVVSVDTHRTSGDYSFIVMG